MSSAGSSATNPQSQVDWLKIGTVGVTRPDFDVTQHLVQHYQQVSVADLQNTVPNEIRANIEDCNARLYELVKNNLSLFVACQDHINDMGKDEQLLFRGFFNPSN